MKKNKYAIFLITFAALLFFSACSAKKNEEITTNTEAPSEIRSTEINSDISTENNTENITEVETEHIHDYSTVITNISATLLKAGTYEVRCDGCGDIQKTVLDIVDPTTLDMPIVYISDQPDAEKSIVKLEKSDGEITVRYQYLSNNDSTDSFEGYCRIKIQGASSSKYPKKNFTIKLYKDEELSEKMKVDLGWGKENKYCMKANYIDITQSRNIVGARLFAEVIKSRDQITEGLLYAPNYGLIDGYPILVYVNEKFHGLYTMNIPKDSWAFAMEGEEDSHEALLMADDWTQSTCMKEPIGNGDFEDYGFEVEHSSTEDEQWIKDSFNILISLLNCDDEDRIREELPQHLDIEAAIDNLLFTYYISAADNLAKNVLWATYDGKIWIPSMYDMDGTFGINASGSTLIQDSEQSSWFGQPCLFELLSDGTVSFHGEHQNKLHEILFTYYRQEIIERWWELRASVLSEDNVASFILNFNNDISSIVIRSERIKWIRGFASQDAQTTDGMIAFIKEHAAKLDAFFSELE